MLKEIITAVWVAAMWTIFLLPAYGGETEVKVKTNPTVIMETSEGVVKMELWADKAPMTVQNFLRYVDEGLYDGTIFHRVIDNFMIQGGGFTPDMEKSKAYDPVKNEAAADLKNDRGTIAMARTNDIDSATSQFFINVKDNDSLDHRDETSGGFGYAVFGKVTEGMDVIDRIKKVKVTRVGPFENVPVKPVTIVSIRRIADAEGDAKEKTP